MINKTSDKNVANIEDDVKYVKELLEIARVFFKAVKAETDYKNVDEIAFCNALENILAEREQKDKRIKELEEENKRKDMFVEMAKEVIENSILKQVVIDKIEEYKKQQNKYENELQEPFAFNYFHREALKLAHKIQALQELLEGEK